jgi:invasion protein IalB
MSDVSSQRSRAGVRRFAGANWGKIAKRIGIGVVMLTAGGVVALAGERLFGGRVAPNEMRVMTFQDWRVICPPLTDATPNCALTADVLRDTGGILLTISMNDPAPGSQLSLTVPHGVLLEPGLGFAVGSEPVRVRPYETCTNTGCIALVTVDADTLKSLSGNMAGQVSVAAPNAQQPINIPFSLKGFADGFGELQRSKTRRTGVIGFLNRL